MNSLKILNSCTNFVAHCYEAIVVVVVAFAYITLIIACALVRFPSPFLPHALWNSCKRMKRTKINSIFVNLF